MLSRKNSETNNNACMIVSREHGAVLILLQCVFSHNKHYTPQKEVLQRPHEIPSCVLLLFKKRNHNRGQRLGCGCNAPDFSNASARCRAAVASDAIVAIIATHKRRLLALVRHFRLELNRLSFGQTPKTSHLDDRLQKKQVI